MIGQIIGCAVVIIIATAAAIGNTIQFNRVESESNPLNDLSDWWGWR